MAYRFTMRDRSIESGLRRIAREQVDRALADIDDRDAAEAVHEVRKRCKKLRAAVRLVRPVFPAYAAENARFRDVARSLSGMRDDVAMIEAYDALTAQFDGRIDRRSFAPIRRRLTWRYKQRGGDATVDAEARLAAARDALLTARQSIDDWMLDADGFDAIAGGLGKTYKRCRKTMKRACAAQRPEAFHEWRKRTKYHRNHARLLRPVWRDAIGVHAAAVDALQENLGDDHDMALLDARLRDAPGEFGRTEDVEAFCALLARRSAALRCDAHVLGRRVFAETRAGLVERWRRYWSVMQDGKGS